MKKLLLSLFTILTLLNNLHSQIPGLSSLIKKVDPSIVKIYTINNRDEYESQGSGVIISNDGIFITNYHVLIGAKKAIVITASGKKFNISKIIDYSKPFDLIKFKVELGAQVTSTVIMNTALPLKGSDVFAVGYPNGFSIEGESTLSTGIISGLREINGEKIIQTSTPFTHGSSGGGLFDATGKLLGITTGTFAEELKDRHANMNKVIPVATIKKLTRNLNLTLTGFYETIRNDELFIKGMIAYESSEFELASEYFNSHLKEYPEDAVAWFRLGNSFNQLGRSSQNKELFNSALECFNISISLDTNYYNPWGQAALIYSITGDISSAKSYAFNAYQIEPNISFTNYVIGKVANEAKEYDLAVEFLGKAIENANEYDKANLMHQWYLEKAIANAWLKKDYDAEQDYKKCLSLNDQNLDAIFWYGNFLSLRKRISESCAQFKKLKTLSPYYKMGGYSVDQMIQYNKCY
jgi:tetratricopeptide (TPR) repeat protein